MVIPCATPSFYPARQGLDEPAKTIGKPVSLTSRVIEFSQICIFDILGVLLIEQEGGSKRIRSQTHGMAGISRHPTKCVGIRAAAAGWLPRRNFFGLIIRLTRGPASAKMVGQKNGARFVLNPQHMEHTE